MVLRFWLPALFASIALPALAIQDTQDVAAARPGAAVRQVGAWDHPYTITEVGEIGMQVHFQGQYSVERVGTKSTLEGDFNGDGLKDMVTRGSRGRTYVLFGQNNFQSQDYEFFKVAAGAWEDVREDCVAGGGDLASIHSERDMMMAKEVCDEWACYIGLQRLSEGQPWQWVDGSPTRFTAWDGGQPNVGGGETKVVFTGANGDKWHDWYDGRVQFAGVCKRTLSTTAIPYEISPEYLNGYNGFVIKGVNPSSIAHGDVNGDGIDDLLLGDQYRRVTRAPPNTCNCLHQAGVLFVVLGTRSGFPQELHVNWLFGWNGFRVEGFVAWGRFGHSLSSGGDNNGDGLQDMVVGTYDIDSTAIGSEELYTLYGKPYSQSPVYDLDTWAPTGWSARLGAAQEPHFHQSFPLWEIFQSDAIAQPPTGDHYLRGFQLQGAPPSSWHWLGRDRTGYSISSSGDINNDGLADIVIGSYGATPGDFDKVMAGAVYVVLGNETFSVRVELASLELPTGFKIAGAKRWDLAGTSVDTSGDIDGDGVKDLVIGAPGVDHKYLDASNRWRWMHNCGKAYVIFGSSALGRTVGDMDLANLALPEGMAIIGAERGSRAGQILTAAGDLNNDGYDDIVLGMPWSSFDFKHSMKGGAHIFYGRSTFTAFTDSVLSVADLHGSDGLTLSGFDLFDMAGHSVSVGDFSGDGKPELLVGVPSHWLIARVWEKTGTAMLLDISGSTTQTPTSTPAPGEDDTTLLDYCQCPQNSNATTYAICVTLETTEVSSAMFDFYAPFVGQSLLNLLLTGNASVARTPTQIPNNVIYQTVEGAESTLDVHITVLFDGFTAATAAIANYDGHGDFEVTVRDSTEMSLTVVGTPGVQSCSTIAAAPPLQVDASGFAVRAIEFDWRCMTAGCWVIDVIYTRGPENSVNTFYLPKTGGADTSDVDALQILYNSPAPLTAEYTDTEKDTFEPKNFPCGSDGYDPANPSWKISGCCIPEFLQNYRPVAEFEDVLLARDFSALCNSTDLSAGPFSSDVFSTSLAATQGVFKGLYLSQFEEGPMAAPGIYSAKIKIDEDELLRHAGMIDPSSSILRRKVLTFVGMAHFVPTDYRFMDSAASQVLLTLEKGDFFTVGSSGEVEQTFIDYMYMRLHEIKDDDSWMQYIAVTFTLSSDWQINDVTGVVPLSSVRVGTGVDSGQASWKQACADNDGNAVWGDATTQQQFATVLQKDCAPAPRLCMSQSAISDSFVSFHIPLGRDSFSTEADYALGNKVFVEFVVSVVNKVTNLQASTTITAEMPIMPGGTSLWCESFEATAELKEIATTDIVVGSAGTEAEMSRLNSISNINSAALSEGAELATYSAASIESGMLTLVVKGDPTIFDRDGFSSYSIEMEHLLTVHVMESGGITSATVQSLIESGQAFEVKVDEIAQTGYLEPTAAMLEVCTFTPKTPTFSNPIPSPCIMRRDVDFQKCPLQVAAPCDSIEINPQDTTEASAFMQKLMGKSDYAFNLGKNFSNLIADKYGVNMRYNRAWWVNPGFVWNPILSDDSFQLSQHVMVAALVRLKGSYAPGAASNRRMLLATPQDYKRGNIGGNILYTQGEYDAQLRTVELMSEILGVPTTSISVWKQVVQLSARQACLPNEELKSEVQELLNEKWLQHNPGLQSLYVNSVVASLNGVECGSRRKIKLRAEITELSQATATIETAVVMRDGENVVNICWIMDDERVLHVEKVFSDPSLQIDSPTSEACGSGGTDTKEQFSLFGLNMTVTTILLAVLGVVGICVCGALIFLCGGCFMTKDEKGNKIHPISRGRRMSMDIAMTMVRRFSGAQFYGGYSGNGYGGSSPFSRGASGGMMNPLGNGTPGQYDNRGNFRPDKYTPQRRPSPENLSGRGLMSSRSDLFDGEEEVLPHSKPPVPASQTGSFNFKHSGSFRVNVQKARMGMSQQSSAQSFFRGDTSSTESFESLHRGQTFSDMRLPRQASDGRLLGSDNRRGGLQRGTSDGRLLRAPPQIARTESRRAWQ